MALGIFNIRLFLLKDNFTAGERDSTSCPGLPPGGRGRHRRGQREGRDGRRGDPAASTGSPSGASMHICNFIYKRQSHSDYVCKEEFKHKVIFPGHFYNVEVNYILEIPELLFTLLCSPELSQFVQFKLYLGLLVNPMSQSHQQFSVHAEYLSGCELQ